MVKIKPFCGIRPPKEYAAEVASRPYDVLNSEEAKAEATERSLLHIIKPEIDFTPIADEFLQGQTAGRATQLADIFIDTAGGLAGVVFGAVTACVAFAVVRRKIKRKIKKKRLKNG